MASSSRTSPQIGSASLAESRLADTWVPVSSATSLPPRSRPISSLFFPPKKGESGKKERRSAHEVKLAYKPGTNKDYFVKLVDPKSPNAEIEAVLGALSKLTSPFNVPSIRTLHNEKGEIVAVSSKAFPGFKPNSEDPLKEEDLVIEIVTKETVAARNHLEQIIHDYLPMLDRTPVRTGSSPSEIAGEWFSHAKNAFNYYTDFTGSTAVSLYTSLEAYLRSSKRFSVLSVRALKQSLTVRDGNTADVREKEHLQLIFAAIDAVLAAPLNTEPSFRDVKKIELLNQSVEAHQITLDTLDDNTILPQAIFDDSFQVTVKTLKNFRILAGLGNGLIIPYIGNNDDNHNRNLSKSGLMIDYDMYGFDETYQFKITDSYTLANLHDWFIRTPKSGQYKHTARDMRTFPDTKDFNPHFWVTQATDLAKSGANSVLAFTENYFSSSDNKNFKNLVGNPVFCYYFYTRLLKTILRSDAMITALADLNIRPDIVFDDKKQKRMRNLKEMLISQQIAIRQEVRSELMKTDEFPEFKEFILSCGDKVFDCLYKEFAQEKLRYQQKIEGIKKDGSKTKPKPYYKSIYEAIDLEKIKATYEAFKKELESACTFSSSLQMSM